MKRAIICGVVGLLGAVGVLGSMFTCWHCKFCKRSNLEEQKRCPECGRDRKDCEEDPPPVWEGDNSFDYYNR